MIRKPINTWILSKIPDKKTMMKDALIWSDETTHKTEWFSSVSRPVEKNFLNYVFKNTNKKNSILHICCNQGRFLKELHKKGYEDLFGIDIMEPAIEILKKSPEYLEGGIYAKCAMAQDYLSKCDDNSIDYAITFSATIELFHPNFNLFKELHRITRKGFIFAINENGQAYPRFYRYLIKSAGFKKINIIKINSAINLLHFMK